MLFFFFFLWGGGFFSPAQKKWQDHFFPNSGFFQKHWPGYLDQQKSPPFSRSILGYFHPKNPLPVWITQSPEASLPECWVDLQDSANVSEMSLFFGAEIITPPPKKESNPVVFWLKKSCPPENGTITSIMSIIHLSPHKKTSWKGNHFQKKGEMRQLPFPSNFRADLTDLTGETLVKPSPNGQTGGQPGKKYMERSGGPPKHARIYPPGKEETHPTKREVGKIIDDF